LKQKQTKSTKKNSSFVSFVPFCSKEIRVIRAIRGGIFAKMSAAWEVMIAITEKSRRGKGERIALQGRRERGRLWGRRNLS
jgi:hypothetical protein